MKNPPLDVTAAGRISAAGNVNLRDVVFVTVNASHIAPSPDGPLMLDWEVAPVVATWDLVAGELKVMFPMSVYIDALKDGDQALKTRVAEVSVVFRLDYQISATGYEGWDEDLEHFVGVCGYLHAWPYFRSEVQGLTNKLGFPPLVLPIVVSGEAATRVSVRSATELREAARPPAPKLGAKKSPVKKLRKNQPKGA
ncbi:MAG: hypothetical protein ABUL60_23640 [Myxococcales bacterium]